MEAQRPDVSELFIAYQRRVNKTTETWECIYCPRGTPFASDRDLKAHAEVDHREQLPTEDGELEAFLDTFAALSKKKRRPLTDSSDLRIPNNVQPKIIPGIDTVGWDMPRRTKDVGMRDAREGSPSPSLKRALVGGGISVRSGNPSASPALRRLAPMHAMPARTGFVSKDNVLMEAQNSTATDVHIEGSSMIAKAIASRGIKGKVKGHEIWAFGDTGATQNIISARQAKKLRLKVVKSPKNFPMGNSKTIFSRGVVTFPWAFVENLDKITNVTAHVVDNFKYDILLCRSFLEDTKTLTDHVSRFVKGIFRRQPMMSFNLLGEASHRLNGFLEGDIQVEGLPDTGSSHNIMNEAWAKAHGMFIQSGPQNCGRVYFPDGSSNPTTGRVHTMITLPGGDAIPIVFEVLPDCYVSVVFGAEFVFDNKIFSNYVDAIHEVEGVDCGNELLPMDYEQLPWCAKLGEKVKVLWQPKLQKHKKKGEPQPEKISNDSAEWERQNRWNHQYQFGKAATREEWDAELSLRESHELRQYPDWHPDPNRPLIRYSPMAWNEVRTYTPVPLEDSSGHSYNYGMFGIDEAALWQAENPG